jgi:hypothetical protein
MTSTIANVAGKTYLCTVDLQESVHGSQRQKLNVFLFFAVKGPP